MTIAVEALPGNFGARVTGLQVQHVGEGDLRDLLQLLLDHRFIVIPDQSLSNEEYVAFGRRWGRPVILISSDNRLDSHPEMIRQSNSGKVPEFFRNNANHWHCDSSYEEEVATATMLYGVESPEQDGVTLFADMVRAYEALPPHERDLLSGLNVQHAVSAATALPGEDIADLSRMPPELRQNAKIPPPVIHPLVQRHPVSGRSALYGLGGSCYGVEGLDPAEGHDLLLRLRHHAARDEFVSQYKLMPGDVLIWDNFSVMHRATPIQYSDDEGRRRLNYRISVKGVPSFALSV